MEKKQNNEKTMKSYSIGNVKVNEWNNGEDKPKNYTVEKFYSVINEEGKKEWNTTKSLNFSELQTLMFLIKEIKREKFPLKVDDY